ncbi:MAG: 5'/3'-nucleotidase SurE [Ilumatobacteraceae bacterium]
MRTGSKSMLAAILAATLSSCGGGGSDEAEAVSTAVPVEVSAPDTTMAPTSEAPTSAPTTVAAPEVLRILVTNDDGYDAEGIDALVEGLLMLPDVEVTVVAPLANQSGTGGNTTEGDLLSSAVSLASGYPATAVDGFPADSIVWALERNGVDEMPHLVVSGINEGQNIALEIAGFSGTVGAARAAALRGVPSLAVSHGVGESIDYSPGVELALEWITEHRDELLAREGGEPLESFTSINVPTCADGTSVRGIVEEVIESIAVGDYGIQDCASTVPESSITGDVSGFNNGFAVETVLAVAGPPFTD